MSKFFRSLFGGLGSDSARRTPNDPKRYRIQKRIGQGGFGTVYEAKDRVTGNIVAIKKIKIDDDGNAEHELNFNMAVSHRNVIRLLGHYREKRKEKDYDQKLPVMDMCLVLEYSKTSLRDCIDEFRKKGKVLPNSIIMLLTFQMYRGLHYLHSWGIIHRDIKPSNLLVNKTTFILQISDLGHSAQMVLGEPRNTLACSLSYRAPELELHNEDYNQKIDIWSAGCVMAECYTGEILFREVKNVQHYDRIRELLGDPTPEDMAELQPMIQVPPPVRHRSMYDQRFALIKPRIPDTAIALMKRCLSYRPSQRPTAIEACADRFYDALRTEKDMSSFDGILYSFTAEEIVEVPKEVIERVIPPRARNEAVMKKLTGQFDNVSHMSAKTARSTASILHASASAAEKKSSSS